MLQGKDMVGDLPPIVNKVFCLVFYNLNFCLQRVEYDGIVERDAYEALCRGEIPPVEPKWKNKLRCYLKRDKPFLKLAPIKVEILRFDPLAVLFKNVIHDSEIEVIKELASPKVRKLDYSIVKLEIKYGEWGFCFKIQKETEIPKYHQNMAKIEKLLDFKCD